jgi:hypothetical protein
MFNQDDPQVELAAKTMPSTPQHVKSGTTIRGAVAGVLLAVSIIAALFSVSMWFLVPPNNIIGRFDRGKAFGTAAGLLVALSSFLASRQIRPK